MAQCKNKKKYGTPKSAARGRMNLWGADPTADLNDLHVYKCPICGFLHIGHKSKFDDTKERDHDNDITSTSRDYPGE